MLQDENTRLAAMLISGAFIGWALRSLAPSTPNWVTLLLAIAIAAVLFIQHARKVEDR